MPDKNLFDFEKHGEMYTDVYKALDFAKTMKPGRHDNLPATHFHFYWRNVNPFGRKQCLPLKSAIVTQDFYNSHFHLWTDKSLSDNPWFQVVEPFVEQHIFDAEEEAVGTPLEGCTRVTGTKDHLCWTDGDIFRLLVLYKYGGVYVDSDVVLLRDLSPLLPVEFMYQWGSELDKINGAIMRMHQRSLLGYMLLGFSKYVPASLASTDFGSTLYGAVRQVYKDWVVFPGAFFNTEWTLKWNMAESAHPFRASEQSKELFDGAFAWHWHNKWDSPIEQGSKFQILESMIDEKYKAIMEAAGYWYDDKVSTHTGVQTFVEKVMAA